MDRKLTLDTFIPTSPEKLFKDWLNSSIHSAFTGEIAKIDPQVGGEFTAWDGYIQGKNIELIPGKRIKQSWRTDDFPADAPDSFMVIELIAENDGARLTLVHSDIPDGQADEYEKGWLEYYFQPMGKYYSSK